MVQNKSPRTRGRPRQFDQDEALDKATRLFWELGYESADTGTLCRVMGMTKPSVYNAFGSKEALFIKALERYGSTLARVPLEAFLDATSPKDALHAFFRASAHNVSGVSAPTGCFYACIGMPAAEQMPSVAAVLEKSFGDQKSHLSASMEDYLEQGVLPVGFDIPRAVSLMMDLMTSMGLNGRMGASIAELEDQASRNAELVWFEGSKQTAEYQRSGV